MDALAVFADFYRGLSYPLRVMIEFRLKRRGLSAEVLLREPWRCYGLLSEELGSHNADLVVALFREHAARLGVDSAVAEEALKSREGWERFAAYVARL